jgi:hypothetical protein
MRLQQGSGTGMVGLLGVVVAPRAAEHHRLTQAGSVAGIWMGAAKPLVA